MTDPIRRRLEKLVEGTALAAKEAALMLAEYDACEYEKEYGWLDTEVGRDWRGVTRTAA